MSDEIKVGTVLKQRSTGQTVTVLAVREGQAYWVQVSDGSYCTIMGSWLDQYDVVTPFFEKGKLYYHSMGLFPDFECRDVVELDGAKYAFGVRYLDGIPDHVTTLTGVHYRQGYEEVGTQFSTPPANTHSVNGLVVCGACEHPASWHGHDTIVPTCTGSHDDDRCPCTWNGTGFKP